MAEQKARKKPLTAKQAQVMRIIRKGGCLAPGDLRKNRYRVLDITRSPIMTIQNRTFYALSSSGRIVRDENNVWIRKGKR